MSHEVSLRETRRSLDEHRTLWLGKRVVRRLRGDYPSRAARRALDMYERENRKPYEKIRDSIFTASSYIDRHNSTMFIYNLGRGRLRTARKVEKALSATEALPFDTPESNKLVAELCTAGGRAELVDDPQLVLQGFYTHRESQTDDEAFGVYLTDQEVKRVEMIPFSVRILESLPPEFQQAVAAEAQGFAELASQRVASNPLNMM